MRRPRQRLFLYAVEQAVDPLMKLAHCRPPEPLINDGPQLYKSVAERGSPRNGLHRGENRFEREDNFAPRDQLDQAHGLKRTEPYSSTQHGRHNSFESYLQLKRFCRRETVECLAYKCKPFFIRSALQLRERCFQELQ